MGVYTKGSVTVNGPAIRENGAFLSLSSKPARALFTLLIILSAVLVYSNTFSSPFQFDDERSIVRNPAIRDIGNLAPSPSVSTTRYIGFLTFAFNYRTDGLNVFGYHLVNLMIHIGCALLVHRLTLLLLAAPAATAPARSRDLIALTAALLFACHPIQTQAVTYIVQRLASLATLFYLLSLVLYIRARLVTSSNPIRSVLLVLLSAVSALLAMFTKEISFTIPFLIILVELLLFPRSGSRRAKLLFLLPFLLLLPVIPFCMIGSDGSAGEILGGLTEAAQETGAIARSDYLLTQFGVVTRYIRLLFIPINQNVDYNIPISRSMFDPAVFSSFLFLLTLLLAAGRLAYQGRRNGDACSLAASFGILWFFTTLSVESSIIPIRDVMFEHRLYLPSVGAVIAFSAGVFRQIDRLRPRPAFVSSVALILLAVIPLGIAAHARNRIWSSELSLWKDTAAKSPGKARTHNALGNAYFNLGRIDEAIGEYEEALRLRPSYSGVHNNLGTAYAKTGRIDEAILEFRLTLQHKPGSARAHFNLGRAYSITGRLADAIAEFGEAILLKPDYPQYRQELAGIYFTIGRVDEAIEVYGEALRLDPNYTGARYNLGLALLKSGRREDAEREFLHVLKIDPGFDDAGRMLESIRNER